VDRSENLARLNEPFDVLVIGGGATGLGVAVDSASRGYRTILFEAHDFAQGASSRSTKLIHGGVRYLQQGNISLVREGLVERARLLHNAPHLVHELRFLIPTHTLLERGYYGIGLKAYDLLAGRRRLSPATFIGRATTLRLSPNLAGERVTGAVTYGDAQFDDARLAIALARTATDHGAVLLNHAPVVDVRHRRGHITAAVVKDATNGMEYEVGARSVVNAAGIFADSVRAMDDPGAAPLLALSQGVHLVLDSHFLPGNTAVLIPHTDDGRVVFLIPWHGRTLVGTTDTPVPGPLLEPVPFEEEIRFLLHHARRYLARQPQRSDVLSAFAGLRPLLRAGTDATGKLSRDYRVTVSNAGLISVLGGKWTAYRRMAQDAVDRAIQVGSLPPHDCVTQTLVLSGAASPSGPWSELGAAPDEIASYDLRFPGTLHHRLPYTSAMAAYVIEREMPVKLEDVLSRRLRALLLDAGAAAEAAPAVAELMARLRGHDHAWVQRQVREFTTLSAQYLPNATSTALDIAPRRPA
jgi:glycerol-3-phosphate dehydrogenase